MKYTLNISELVKITSDLKEMVSLNSYELLPVHIGQKSYYGKAIVIEDRFLNRYLQSYETIVCGITRNGVIKFWDHWSVTTSKHIKDFLMQFGFKDYCKKEWLALEVGKPYQEDQAKKLFRIKETAKKGTGLKPTTPKIKMKH